MTSGRLVVVLSPALVATACTSAGGPGTTTAGSPGSSAPTSPPTESMAPASNPITIPQPPLGALKGLAHGLLAPEGDRVDLAMPSFSEPTAVTNALFPISELHSVIALGVVDGQRLKVEPTLLPGTKLIEWNGQRVETVQAQFVAYHNGRIAEVAVDWYAQDDAGAVWYFGEDVFIYEDGRVVGTEGTWRAGVDGPVSMIMPADPQVGDAYRSENVPGLIFFEESTVKRIGATVQGPTGPVDGAMIGQELHIPGDLEDKTFAPGYGEFFSGSGGDFEAMALAVPTDDLPDPTPVELETLSVGAEDVFDAAMSEDWRTASAAIGSMAGAWDAFRTGEVPPRLAAQMRRALRGLIRSVGARDERRAAQGALDVANASLDLQLRYRPPADVDTARLDLWAAQLLLDAAAGDAAAVVGDVTTLEWIRDRIALADSDGSRIDDQLRYLRAAAEAQELEVVAEDAARLRESIAGIGPAP